MVFDGFAFGVFDGFLWFGMMMLAVVAVGMVFGAVLFARAGLVRGAAFADADELSACCAGDP